jgi:hypothetical protein
MQNSSAFQYLAIDTIHESAANPRRTFEESKLHEFAESIRQHGLIQPITVRPNSEGFEIVAERDASAPRNWQSFSPFPPASLNSLMRNPLMGAGRIIYSWQQFSL